MLHTQLAALALAATAFAVSGCGGSSKAESSSNASATTTSAQTASAVTGEATTTKPTGKVLTRAELIAKADVICARANAELESGQVARAQDYARVLPLDAIYFRTESASLGKLTPPASMEGSWKQIVVGFQTVSRDLTKVGQYAQTNKLTLAAPAFNAANNTREHIIAIAKRDGFKDCARVHK